MPWLSPARPWLWPREASSSFLWPHCSQVAPKGQCCLELVAEVALAGGQAASAGWWREDVYGSSTVSSGGGELRLCWLFLAGTELVHR